MRYSLGWLLLVASTGCGAPDEQTNGGSAVDSEIDAAQFASLDQALTAEAKGVWSKTSGTADGAFLTLHLIDRAVNSAAFPGVPVGAKHFYARVEAAGGPPETIAGYYLESATQLTLGRLGSVSANAARYVCATASCDAPAIYDVTQCGSGEAASLTLQRSTMGGSTTLLHKQSSLNVSGQTPAAVVIPNAPSRIEELSAYELKRHIQLVLGGNVQVYSEATLPAAVVDSATLLYVGKTQLAQAVGLRDVDLPDEGYLIEPVGRTLVLLGKETGAAVAPGSVTWASNESAMRLTATSPAFYYEVQKDDNLFSTQGATPGGTLEMWLRDDSTCATSGPCGASVMLRLTQGKMRPSFSLVGYNLAGNATTLVPFIGDGNGGNLEVPYFNIPRDGNVHHVTLSFAPCGQVLCVSTWVDGATIRQNVAMPGTQLSSLDLSKPWTQRLQVNELGAPGLSASMFGLRFANRPTTFAEHQSRPTPAALTQLGPQDKLVLDFAERSGLPTDKAGGRPLMPLLPSRWGQRGTLHAAYEVLDRFFGVRWYMPGDLGLAYSHQCSVNIPTQRLALQLPLRHRDTRNPIYLTPLLHLTPDSPGEAFEDEQVDLWALRMRLGGEPLEKNHAFYNFRTLQRPAHPSWFSSYMTGQPCFDDAGFNDKVATYAQAYAASVSDAAYLPTEAGLNMPRVKNGAFSVTPLDADVFPRFPDGSFAAADCNYVSAQARGLVNANYPPTQFFSGEASEYVFDFYNRMAAELDEVTPPAGRSPYVAGLAYLDYSFPPTQAIHAKVHPTVNFELQEWGSANPQSVGPSQLAAWQTKMGARGYMGWTYLIDSVIGRYSMPYFGYASFAASTKQMLSLGVNALYFEHSYSYDARSPKQIANDAVLQGIVEDFRNFVTPSGYHQLWDQWPLSMGLMYNAGPGHAVVFNCKNKPGENPAESYEPSYSPYCQKYNNALPQNQDVFARMQPLMDASTASRGLPDAQLENYLLMRLMATPSLDTAAALTEFFDLYYGAAAGPMRAFHEAMTSIPKAYQITQCDQTPALNGYLDNQCRWPQRVSRAMMYQLSALIDAAEAVTLNGSLTEQQSKRVRAFSRNVWCTMSRAYYMYYPEGPGERAADPLRMRHFCQEDPTLHTYTESYLTRRYVLD